MKKIILAATFVLGISAMSFAQTSPVKTAAVKQPAKMSITKNQTTSSKSMSGVTEVTKTPGKSGVTNGTKTATVKPKTNNNAATIKHPKDKKLKKAQKKAAKSGKKQ